MKNTIDLCVPCAEQMRAEYDMSKTAAGANNKITCVNCNRRRYGATYEVTPKRRKGARATLPGLVGTALGMGMTPGDVAKRLGLKKKEGELNG